MSLILHNNKKILYAILFLGILLRVSTLFWGFPVDSFSKAYHPDEEKAYATAYRFPEVYKTDHRFLTYGTNVTYTIGAFLFPVKVVLTKILDHDTAYYNLVWFVSRCVSVMLGVFSILLLYLFARKYFDSPGIALLSAFYLSISFLHTLHSSFATLDVPMCFFLLLNFWLVFEALENPQKRRFMYLGIATAFLVGTKLSSGVFVLVPISMIVWRIFFVKGSDWCLLKGIQYLLIYGGTASFVYFLYQPHFLFDPQKYLQAYMDSKYLWVDRHPMSFVEMVQNWYIASVDCMGHPVFFAGIAGVFISGKRMLPEHRFQIVLFILLYYVLWSSWFPTRFAIPLVPYFCLFAAAFVLSLIQSKWNSFRLIGWAFGALIIFHSLYMTTSGVIIRQQDTRTQAARYLAESIPEGSQVGIATTQDLYPGRLHDWRYPKIDFNKYNEANFLESPEYLVVSSYDSQKIIEKLSSPDLLEGYRWNPEATNQWYNYKPPSPEVFAFYDRLFIQGESGYVLMKSFKAEVNVPLDFPPPEIFIFKIEG